MMSQPWKLAGLVDPLEPHLTLYHGTTNRGYDLARQRGGLHAWHPRDVANEVANHYGLDPDELYNHPYFEFSRSGRDENNIYTHTDPRVAQSYANARSEQLTDAVRAAHRMLHPELYNAASVEGIAGASDQRSRQALNNSREQFVQDYFANNNVQPQVLRLNVPQSAIPIAHQKQIGWPDSTYVLPAPVPLDWVSPEKTASNEYEIRPADEGWFQYDDGQWIPRYLKDQDTLQTRHGQGEGQVAYHQGEPVASVTWQETPEQMLLGSAWTHPDHRGKGLFNSLSEPLRASGKPVDAQVWENPWLKQKVQGWNLRQGSTEPKSKFLTTREDHERSKVAIFTRKWQLPKPPKQAALEPHHLQSWINQFGPYLYHHTSADAKDAVLNEGLYPHDELRPGETTQLQDPLYRSRSKWAGDFYAPRPGHVYLGTPERCEISSSVGGFRSTPGRLAVDLRKLDPVRMNPDEDFYWENPAAASPITEEEPLPDPEYHATEGGMSLGEWANYANIGSNPEETHASLRRHGSIAYNGVIPPEAIIDSSQAYPEDDPRFQRPQQLASATEPKTASSEESQHQSVDYYHGVQRYEDYCANRSANVSDQNRQTNGYVEHPRRLADYYHVAPTTERARIQQHGLQPSRPALNDRWHEPGYDEETGWETDREPPQWLQNQPEGVYAEGNPERARGVWGNDPLLADEFEDQYPFWDTWRIPKEQVRETAPDPITRAVVIKHPVYPELHEGGPEAYGPWPERKQAMWPFTRKREPLPTPEEMAQGRQCYFHPDRPAVSAQGFAAMCPECLRNYEQAGQPMESRRFNSDIKTAMPYHVAPTQRRKLIEQEGLRPDADRINQESDHPSGVYMWDDPEVAWKYRGQGPNMYRDMDVWHVNTEGLPLERDPWFDENHQDRAQDFPGGRYYPGVVPPERLSPEAMNPWFADDRPHPAWKLPEPEQATVASIKTADKLHDFLMNPKSRPDLQTPEGQGFLQHLEKHYHNDKTDALMPWLTREWKKGRIANEPDLPHDARPVKRLEESPEEYAARLDQPNLTIPELSHGGRTWHHVPIRPGDLNHWGDFMRSNHPLRREMGDIMQHKMPEFQQRIQAWDQDMADRAKQEALQGGKVVHATPDNWTIRQLQTPEELKAEGDAMGHCAGSYSNQVRDGDSLIYSLRDPKGIPHATTEIEPTRHQEPDPGWLERALAENATARGLPEDVKDVLRAYEADPNRHQWDWDRVTQGGRIDLQGMRRALMPKGEPIPHNGEVVQIQGKANQEPQPEYKAKLRHWFESFPEGKRPRWGESAWDYEPQLYDAREIGDQHLNPNATDEYGLPPRKVDPNYQYLLGSTMQDVWHGQVYDHGLGQNVYQLARARGEIPELAKEVEQFAQQNQDRYDRYAEPDPGNPHPDMYDWDDPEETNPWKEEGYDYDKALERYDEHEGERMMEDPGMQANDHLYGMINRHWNPETSQYENGTFK